MGVIEGLQEGAKRAKIFSHLPRGSLRGIRKDCGRNLSETAAAARCR